MKTRPINNKNDTRYYISRLVLKRIKRPNRHSISRVNRALWNILMKKRQFHLQTTADMQQTANLSFQSFSSWRHFSLVPAAMTTEIYKLLTFSGDKRQNSPRSFTVPLQAWRAQPFLLIPCGRDILLIPKEKFAVSPNNPRFPRQMDYVICCFVWSDRYLRCSVLSFL